MFQFLIYTLKAALLTATFYSFWRLLLAKESFHRLNRVMLMLIPLVSLILPLCVITIHKTEFIEAMDMDTPAGQTAEALTGGIPAWRTILAVLYLTGLSIVLMKTILSLVKISKIIKEGKRKVIEDGTVLIITERDIPPLSWMNYIVLSEKDSNCYSPEIIRHEKAHIRLRHSLDILLADILTSVQWYNPMAWMLRSDLRGIHEYEADEEVLKQGIDATQYQLFLIRKAAADRGYTVVNSFNSGSLKSRITMMTRKSPKLKALKAMLLIPIIGISLAATARTVTDYTYLQDDGKDNVPFQLVETKPTFNGGDANEFSKWVNSQLTYPDSAYKKGVSGRVILSFKITETGDLTEAKVLKFIDPLNPDATSSKESEALCTEALRVIKSSPKWTPGEHKGKKVAVVYTYPVIFVLR